MQHVISYGGPSVEVTQKIDAALATLSEPSGDGDANRLRERVAVLEHVLRRFCPTDAPCCCDDWMAADPGETKCVYCAARDALALQPAAPQ